MAVTWNLSVVAAAAAVQCGGGGGECIHAFTKLASRSLLSPGGVGVGLFVDLGALPPMRSLKDFVCDKKNYKVRVGHSVALWVGRS